MKKGIIFDLDGTLWNSAQTVSDSWNDVIRSYGGKTVMTAEWMMTLMGKPMDEIAEVVFAEFPGEKLQLLDKCAEREHEFVRRYGGELFSQVAGQLRAMQEAGFELCIVSNCQAGYIEAFLGYYTELAPFFVDTECWGATGLQKDENIRLVVERQGIDKPVYVGDTQRDCDSAEAAGVPFIHAAYGFGTIDHEVPEAHSFEEILPLAKQLTQ